MLQSRRRSPATHGHCRQRSTRAHRWPDLCALRSRPHRRGSTANRTSLRARAGVNHPGCSLVEDAVQPHLARRTDDEALGKERLQQLVGYSVVTGRGDSFCQGGDTGYEQQVRNDLHGRPGSERTAVLIAGGEIVPESVEVAHARRRPTDEEAPRLPAAIADGEPITGASSTAPPGATPATRRTVSGETVLTMARVAPEGSELRTPLSPRQTLSTASSSARTISTTSLSAAASSREWASTAPLEIRSSARFAVRFHTVTSMARFERTSGERTTHASHTDDRNSHDASL